MIPSLGFSTFEDILSPQECDSLAKALNHVPFHRGRAGIRNLMSNPAISKLAYDSRLQRIAHTFLDTAAIPFRATLFDKSGASNWHVQWHQDRALPVAERAHSSGWGPWSTKSGVLYALAPAWALNRVVALRVHLDPSTEDNGPLRVIPGSHHEGVLSSEDILQITTRIPANACLVGRGGVVAMRPLLLHSSMKARDNRPRRVLHIEYATDLKLGDVRLSVA